MKELRTRSVKRSAYKNYLIKAEEFYNAMIDCHNFKRWNAVVLNAVHCAISCCDALTVFYLGFRHCGERHGDAIELLKKIEFSKEELSNKIGQFSILISIKNSAEYEERLLTEKDAENSKKACERFYSWTKNKLKEVKYGTKNENRLCNKRIPL